MLAVPDRRRHALDGVSWHRLEDVAPSDVMRIGGLLAPVHEHALPNERVRSGFVDRCRPDVRLIVGGDGRKWHHRFQQALADADRTLEAQAVGWETSRLLWEHLAHDPAGTAGLLRQVHDGRRRLLDPNS